MNRNMIATAVIAACVAALCTLAWSTLFAPGTVQAAPDPAPKAKPQVMRVALANLEAISRNSPKFKALKREWDVAQAEMKQQYNEWQEDYDSTYQQLQRAKLKNDQELVMELRVHLQATDQTMKACEEEGKKYLSALLSQFQTEVLREVMLNLERYVRQKGFDIVLQDYTLELTDEDFFGAGEYAQTMMSKPVLSAPGALDGKNLFVTDITQELITAMQKGGVPEDPDDG